MRRFWLHVSPHILLEREVGLMVPTGSVRRPAVLQHRVGVLVCYYTQQARKKVQVYELSASTQQSCLIEIVITFVKRRSLPKLTQEETESRNSLQTPNS
jgi:hypothetical protein